MTPSVKKTQQVLCNLFLYASIKQVRVLISAEWTDVKKPVGDIAQWQVLPIDLTSMPSGQVFLIQRSPSHTDKPQKGILHDREKQNYLIN